MATTTHNGPVSIDALESYLPDSTTGSLLRPIITNLNDDNAWLLSCPQPASERQKTGRYFYHIALDPWLTNDAAIMWKSWFFSMGRKTAAEVPSAEALGALVGRIEAIAAKKHGSTTEGGASNGGVDAIFISNVNSDHCHRETLLGFSPDVPVFAASGADKKISKWSHFETVIQVKTFDPATESWQKAHPGTPLPEWLTVIEMLGHTPANFGFGIIISSSPPSITGGDDATTAEQQQQLHELILLTPHGLLPTQPHLQVLFDKPSPPVNTLAIMHPVKESWTLGAKIYLGVRNALALAQKSRAPYYVKTADATLNLTGIFSYAQSEKAASFQAALEEGEKETGGGDEDGELYVPAFYEVDNGKCLVLE